MDVWIGKAMFEKRWAAVSPQLFTSNGTPGGVITVMDSSLFKVKQQVNITANTLPNLNLEIKSVPNDVTIVVGPIGANIFTYQDVSAYTVALAGAISANEQKRSSVPVEEINRAVYEEEPTVALRNVLVDKHGKKIDSDNPLPTTAIIDIGDITVDVALDSFTKVPADNVISVGTDDGTKTGVKRAHKIGADGKLETKDTDANTSLDNIETLLSNPLNVNTGGLTDAELRATPVPVSGPLTDAQLRASPVPVLVTGGGDATAANQVIANTLLSAINTQLTSGTLKVDDDETQTLLGNIISQLVTGGLIIGTENGQPSGVQHVFVNNLKSMILASHDRVRDVTYLDAASKKNRRVEKFEFTSLTFPGITLVREFNYNLIGSDYVFINDNWTLI